MDKLAQDSRGVIERGSKSFSGAARLLPSGVRDRASMLYAWCRHCDDVIDDQVMGHAAEPSGHSLEARLESLYDQTRDAVAGVPQPDPAFEALRRVVQECEIPERFPIELIDGFAMDVSGRRYETIEDTLLYCYHVAGVVGVMMAIVMGVRDRPTLKRASDLGIALQLTNIARDVGDDAAIGRVYLPAEWLREAGADFDRIGEPDTWPAVARATGRLLDTAEPYYRSAAIGLRRLPFRCAWAIATARGVYRAIGHGVRRRGDTAWEQRVSTGTHVKLGWAALGGVQAAVHRGLQRDRPGPSRDQLWTKPDFDV